jgi:hypothetical protein
LRTPVAGRLEVRGDLGGRERARVDRDLVEGGRADALRGGRGGQPRLFARGHGDRGRADRLAVEVRGGGLARERDRDVVPDPVRELAPVAVGKRYPNAGDHDRACLQLDVELPVGDRA